MGATTTMPAAFIGHGSPMNTLQVNRFTQAWRDLGRSLPRPRAILAISAHWFINGTAVTAMPQPRVIHDFYGFPKELFEFNYPAPGSPELADEVVELVRPGHVGLDRDSWGLDHGTWSILAHLFPQADIPVVQLSVHAGEPIDYHVQLGRRLAPLRERGVFIVGSGNVVHNLRRVDRVRVEQGYDWALRFDAAVKEVMASAAGDLGSVLSHPDAALAVPTPEHFLPLAYLCGLSARAGEPAHPFAESATLGSLTMTSYLLGASPPASRAAAAGADQLPAAARTPPDQTNI